MIDVLVVLLISQESSLKNLSRSSCQPLEGALHLTYTDTKHYIDGPACWSSKITEGFSRKIARLQISTFDGKVPSSSLKLDINSLD